MQATFKSWLRDIRNYSDKAQIAHMHRVKRVEKFYGNIDEHIQEGTIEKILKDLEYSTEDQRHNRPNLSKIELGDNVDIRANLQSYKTAIVRYMEYLSDNDYLQDIDAFITNDNEENIDNLSSTEFSQKLSLEKDMQAALRNNISQLDAELKIIDGGIERAVSSGLIDITCEDNNGIVVIELKAGKADSRAIGQILGYMGDLQEEDDKPVRGILIAHDFDQRTKSAARIVPNLALKKYCIEFKFIPEE